jgi:hypothetical protein
MAGNHRRLRKDVPPRGALPERLSFPKTFPPGDSQNHSTTLEGRQLFSAYGILATLSKSFSA